MDFAEARETFLQPRAGAGAPVTDTPALRLRHVLEPLAMINVWSAPAHDHLAAAGLDFLTGYVGGRGCVLGDPSPGVVAATFAVFEPGLAGELWRQARAACSVEELLAVREIGGAGGAAGRPRGRRRRRGRAGHADAARGPRRRRARGPRRSPALRRAARSALADATRTPRSGTSRRSTGSTGATRTSGHARRRASTGSRRTSSPSSGSGSTSTSTPARAAGHRRPWTPRWPGSPPAAGWPTAP